MSRFCACPSCKSQREMDRKFEAAIMLLDFRRRITVPTKDEWIGLNLMERDDGLKRRKDEK